MDRSTTPPAWRSGAALAVGGAVAAMGTHLSLRAASQGPPPTPAVLVGATLALALLLWPLAARTTRVTSLAAVLILAQVGTHLTVLLSSGRLASRSASGLFCCPPGERAESGLVGRLTAHGGWGLFVVQLLACVLLALAVRGGRRSLDVATAALALLHSVLRPTWVAVRALLHMMLRQITPAPPAPAPRAHRTPPRCAATGLLVLRRLPRRGPPACTRPAVLQHA